MSERQESNLRPRGPKPRALPTALLSDGAGGGTRTRTELPPRDFKSRASTISPPRHQCAFYNVRVNSAIA